MYNTDTVLYVLYIYVQYILIEVQADGGMEEVGWSMGRWSELGEQVPCLL